MPVSFLLSKRFLIYDNIRRGGQAIERSCMCSCTSSESSSSGSSVESSGSSSSMDSLLKPETPPASEASIHPCSRLTEESTSSRQSRRPSGESSASSRYSRCRFLSENHISTCSSIRRLYSNSNRLLSEGVTYSSRSITSLLPRGYVLSCSFRESSFSRD